MLLITWFLPKEVALKIISIENQLFSAPAVNDQSYYHSRKVCMYVIDLLLDPSFNFYGWGLKMSL